MSIAQFPLTDLYPLPDQAVLKGTVEIFGVSHHVYFVEVTWREDKETSAHLSAEPTRYQDAVNDPEGYFMQIAELNNEALEEVEIPGYPGKKFVTVVYPYAK